MHDFNEISIDTLNLKLLAITSNQKCDLFKLYSDKETLQYTDNEIIVDVSDAARLINLSNVKANQKLKISLGILYKNTDKLVGTISIYNIDWKHSFSSLGIILDKEYWNRGVMQEALKYFLNYYFYKLNFNRLEAQTFVENKAAIKLFERLNFKNEGRLRENFLINEKYEDSYLFSILKSDFTKFNNF